MVLDAGVLFLHFAGHEGVRKYFEQIITRKCKGLISAFSLAEFYYKTCQKLGKQTAYTWYFQLRNSELIMVYKEELIRAAALEKCKHAHKLSLADFSVLALAKAEKALLITKDREPAKVGDVKTKHI
jgi:predicted nucleic acid-binding protein